jgi:hypothetical protein
MAGEAKNPKRDVSRAVITAMLIAQLSTWHSRSRSSDRSSRGTLRTAWTKAVLKPLLREQWKNLEAIDACTDLDYDRYGFRVPAVIEPPTLAGSALPWTATDTPAPTRSPQDGSTS